MAQMTAVNLPGGTLYPQAFDPKPYLDEVSAFVDLSQTRNLDSDSGTMELPGPKRHDFDAPEQTDEQHQFTERLQNLALAMGIQIVGSNLQILVYAEHKVLMPHVDMPNGATIQPIFFNLLGTGTYHTFGPEQVDEYIFTNAYPSSAQSSLPINAGDIFLPRTRIFHGFQNGPSPRVVAALL